MEGSQRSDAIPRKPAVLDVDCATEDMSAPVTLTTKDVGEGGLFIQTEYPLEAGSRFGTRFDLGDGSPILAECEVAWVRTGPPEATPPPGMGVRFVALEPRDAARLKGWITGEEVADGAETPRVTFRIEGLGQTVPGEFRASSDDGMSAVAELPFLKIGSAVQVTVDQPGATGPRTGRIAWLVMEDCEDEIAGAPPRVRIGINFDPAAEAALAKEYGSPVPIPLTQKKAGPSVPVSTALTMGVPQPTAAAGGAVATPWELGPHAADPQGERPVSTRRRVRPRQGRRGVDLGHLVQTLKGHAARNPRMALGVMAIAVLLLIGLVSALALSGGSKPASKSKPKATPLAAAPADQAAADPDGPAPGAPALDAPAGPALGKPGAPTAAQGQAANLAAPGPGNTPGAGPGAAPSLPGDPSSGRQVLTSGPGANADPDKVLAAGKDPQDGLLGEPKSDPAPAAKLRSFTLGKKLVVKLPTKTKPQALKHYLLANPDGVVVDAVGAEALLRPGRYPVKDPRVKHVRVLHRGKDTRFILYYGKGVKGPKMSLAATDEGVSFAITTAQGPAMASASAPAKGKAASKVAAVNRQGKAAPKNAAKAALGKAAPRNVAKTARGKAASKGQAKGTASKLKAVPAHKASGKRPAARPRPAPIADAEL